MKRIKPGEVGYSTTNAILAYCLHLAGVQWYDMKHCCRVLYSKDMILKFMDSEGKPRYKGWNFRDAVIDAHKKELRGHIAYRFEQAPRLKFLLEAFKEQEEELEKSFGYVHELVQKVIQEKETDIRMMKLACIILKTRLDFMALWTHQVPCMLIPDEGEMTTTDEGIQIVNGVPKRVIREDRPGMKIVSTNASKDTLEHLELI